MLKTAMAGQKKLQTHIVNHLISMFMLALPDRADIGDAVTEAPSSSDPPSRLPSSDGSISWHSHLSEFGDAAIDVPLASWYGW
jgi:hypothetical protein